MLTAGFPCQPFSVAGQRGGFEDERGNLFFEIARILADRRPEFFILENVPGLLSHQEGKTCAKIFETLSEIGYSFEWDICNSAAFDVPQTRKRLYIVGYTEPRCAGKIFPIGKSNPKSLKQIVGGTQGKRVYSADGKAMTQTASGGGFAGKTGLYFIDLNPDPKLTGTARCITARYDAGISGNHKGERSGVLCEEKMDGNPKKIITIAAHDGTYRRGRIRKLTPNECWRLRGFSDAQFEKAASLGFSDCQLYKLAGNAVTVNVVKEIGEKIKELWNEFYLNESGGTT